MIITRGGTAKYKEGADPSHKINEWLKANPSARLMDVKLAPTHDHDYADVYMLMILEVPDGFEKEG